MAAKVMIIWDYDTPIARITATKPYNYHFEKCLQEANDIDTILASTRPEGIKMTFAVVGYGAEKSVYPFEVGDKIRKIHSHGHEIASHSWKHEWFPFLTKYQIEKSIERSKYILEECLQAKGIVKGFVPPHDRPMSWPEKLAFSLGDRALYPFHPGASLGYLLKELQKQNFTWCRTTYRSIWNKLIDWNDNDYENRIKENWSVHRGIVHFRGAYYGFDQPVYKLIDKSVRKSLPLVIVAHPAGLSRKSTENIELFEKFLERILRLKQNGDLTTHTVSDYIDLSGLTNGL